MIGALPLQRLEEIYRLEVFPGTVVPWLLDEKSGKAFEKLTHCGIRIPP